MVGVQSNEFPRALDLGPQVRAFGIPVIVGGSHVSGWRCCDLARAARDNHGALTICLHAGGKPASVSAGFCSGGIKGGGGCSVDSLNQKSSS